MQSVNSNSHPFPVLLFSVDENSENEYIEIENSYFSLYPNEEENRINLEMNSLSLDDSTNSIISLIYEDPMPSLDEIIPIFPPSYSNDSFSSSKLSNLFNSTESTSVLIKEEESFLGRKRSKVRRPRMYNRDDMHIKIKRGFFNEALIKKLNDKLKSFGSKLYLEKFPKYFASDVCKKRNKVILDMTLGEIFEKQELFTKENKKGWLNYFHNLKVVRSKEIKENEKFQKILSQTFRQLYEEYINSYEFKVNEINRLKRKNMKDDYIKRYEYVARNLMKFFSN